MMSIKRRSTLLRLAPVAAGALGVVAGCAAGGNAADAQPPGQRIIVTTIVEWPSVSEVVLRVADITGMPVREPLEDAPRRYRMTLQCGPADSPACAEAIKRLSAARSFVHAVERDPRQRIPGKPDRESSR